VNLKLFVTGFAPPVVALTVMVELPAGVPGFELLLEVLPPHELSHRVERPRATMRVTIRIAPRLYPFRDPARKIMPNNPGSKTAKKIRLLCSCGVWSRAVGAVVVTESVMEVLLLVTAGLKLQLASRGRPVQE
jgi:hypothetical protein